MSKRVKVENLEQGKVRLTISVSAEEFDNALDKAFEKAVKEVKVDGFRPGKMPKNVFIKRFGWEALYSDALDIVLQETYPVAIHESKVIPVSEPSIDLDFKSLSKGKGFKYTADLEIWEKSELGQYGIEIDESKEEGASIINDKVFVYNISEEGTSVMFYCEIMDKDEYLDAYEEITEFEDDDDIEE